ncbi:MAG: hypothetical protein ACE5KI_07105, partial [Dehalococcoidia bacterium]
RNEMTCTLEDLMERRLSALHWDKTMRLRLLRDTADVICRELDMSDEEFDFQLHAYEAYLEQLHSLPYPTLVNSR